MNSQLGCESVCTSRVLFELVTYSYKILSRMWVAMHFLGSIWISDVFSWNSIQIVSCCAPPGLHLNYWHICMKSYPESELLCIFWAPFEMLTCLYDILSRMWVAVPLLGLLLAFFFNEIISSLWVTVHLLGSVWIMDLLSWNYIQIVSCCAPSGLYLNHWHASMKSHPASELIWSFWFLFESLTHLYKISSRL